jgi:hypothetical protein
VCVCVCVNDVILNNSLSCLVARAALQNVHRCLCAGLFRHVASKKFTEISDLLTAFILRAILSYL